MSKLLKSLLTATAFLSLAPTAASALPPQCSEICPEFYGYCDVACAVGGRITTCGQAGMCNDAHDEPSDVTASAARPQARQPGESQVCSEEQHAAERSASLES